MSMPAKEEINAPTPGDINQELKELVNAHARQTSEGLEVEEGYSEAFTKLSALINSFRFALAEEQRRQKQ
ncbi:hypothetical protein E3P96_02152 [Wallemia ichthyophaga]|nr:hypothetical protein E3P96_02152 [Wallemia ichthyophaga]